MKTKTVFRVWGDTGDVIALFPEVTADGPYVQSYMHIGQHGAADYSGIIECSSPAKPEEFAELLAELTRIGYEVEVVRRRSPKMRKIASEAI